MPFQKPTAGQALQTTPIASAAFQGQLVDVVDDFNRRQMGSPIPKQTPPVKTNEIRIANGSAADRRKGEILKIGTFSLSDVDRRTLWFNGTVPTETTDTVAVLLEPIKYADTGFFPAQVMGIVPAIVDIQTEGDRWANVEADSPVLVSATSSGMFEILHAPSGTGEKDCVILMDRATVNPRGVAMVAPSIATYIGLDITYGKFLACGESLIRGGVEYRNQNDNLGIIKALADGRYRFSYHFPFNIMQSQDFFEGQDCKALMEKVELYNGSYYFRNTILYFSTVSLVCELVYAGGSGSSFMIASQTAFNGPWNTNHAKLTMSGMFEMEMQTDSYINIYTRIEPPGGNTNGIPFELWLGTETNQSPLYLFAENVK